MTVRTITMTNRPPVRIEDDNWPVLAEGSEFDGQFEAQANRRAWIKVRQHEDGRTLVYGKYTTCYQGERDRAGGELLQPGADIVAAIRRMSNLLGWENLDQRVIADLPAEDI